MAKTSQSKLDANARYIKKAYEQITFSFRRDSGLSREVLRAHAEAVGESLNGFLKRAVIETMERDKNGENKSIKT